MISNLPVFHIRIGIRISTCCQIYQADLETFRRIDILCENGNSLRSISFYTCQQLSKIGLPRVFLPLMS